MSVVITDSFFMFLVIVIPSFLSCPILTLENMNSWKGSYLTFAVNNPMDIVFPGCKFTFLSKFFTEGDFDNVFFTFLFIW